MDIDIKIYFDNRVVVLTDDKAKNVAIKEKHLYVFKNKKALAKRINVFERTNEENLFIVHSDLGELFSYVKKCFTYINAGGGVVFRPDGRLLLIKRLGKWDLPKGKAEKGEALQKTAIREVVEECGLKNSPAITAELAHTYHSYRHDGKHILKHTVWFSMLYDGDEELQPQYDEDITQAVWMSRCSLGDVMQNTYQSIKEVLSVISIDDINRQNKNKKIE